MKDKMTPRQKQLIDTMNNYCNEQFIYNENDIVLDCFMGSGTTAVACKEIGRQYVGFEIEPKWVKVANDRLNKTDANGQTCMFLR